MFDVFSDRPTQGQVKAGGGGFRLSGALYFMHLNLAIHRLKNICKFPYKTSILD